MRETPGPLYSKHPLTNNTRRQRVQFYKGKECETAKLRVLLREKRMMPKYFATNAMHFSHYIYMGSYKT